MIHYYFFFFIDISMQLSSAQSRCILLEKQLEYTKRMVLNVEREKNMILEQQVTIFSIVT